LKSVTIPSGVTEIKHCTFYDCGKLESVFFKGDAPKLNPEWWWSFGGNPTVYYCPSTKGWGKELAGKLTAVWIADAKGSATNLVSTAFRSAEAESRQDWEAALRTYEDAYDSKTADEFLRSTLRTKFRELRPKVTPNRDPAQAGTWIVKAYAIRQLDFRWTDADKQARHTQWKMADAEVEAIRASLTAFAERVWDFTSGNLRIDWTLEVIDTPLTRLDGDANAGFWPGPGSCIPLLTAFKSGDADTVMVYAKLRSGPDEPGTALPIRFAGWASGVTGATQGATFAGFALGREGGQEAPGERELRQWLHNAKWTMEEHQAYPHGLLASPDGGRDEGEMGGDYCYRRKPGEQGWMGYYRHLMTEHVTRRMWRELSVRKASDTFWNRQSKLQYAQHALLVGYFPSPGKDGWGINEPFIDEANFSMPKAGDKVGDREWKTIQASNNSVFQIDRSINVDGEGVSYLAFLVNADGKSDARIAVGVDNGCRVFLNGKEILFFLEWGGVVPDRQCVDIQLSQGQNLFLVKVSNGGGPTGAAFRLTAPDGGPLEGVRYVVE